MSQPRNLNSLIRNFAGLSGRHTFSLLHKHPHFTVAHIIGSPASAGIPFFETWTNKEAKLQAHHSALNYEPLPPPPHRPVHGETLPTPTTFETFLQLHTPSSIKYIISTVAPSLATHLETHLSSLGFTIITISPANRTPLNTFVLERSLPSSPLQIYASPNCVACGVTPVLSAIYANAGQDSINNITITTIQSLTGRGDSPYPSELCVGSMLPVGQLEETETYLQNELTGLFFSSSSTNSHSPNLDVRCYRGGALRGHMIDLRISLTPSSTLPDPTTLTSSTVISWLQSFDPLSSYHASARTSTYHITGSSPPILVSPSPNGVLQSSVVGMQVVVTNVSVTSSGCIRCTVIVDNLIKGAAGAAIQIMEYVEFQENLRPWKS
ncbi:hypothetical protein TL16_g11806 [Triparma laevis f. inornata]|uniref:Uncharacterized protein n=1 Tax=Triparma laevis f. inornata TaxID=1714386 RepID=A0A9W7ETZ3_9STRA|nr:hypothetical protein TL16_g11806 [Triparma laevis f. inornata]